MGQGLTNMSHIKADYLLYGQIHAVLYNLEVSNYPSS